MRDLASGRRRNVSAARWSLKREARDISGNGFPYTIHPIWCMETSTAPLNQLGVATSRAARPARRQRMLADQPPPRRLARVRL